MQYQFIGQEQRFYPAVFVNARSLIANPGDVIDFDEPPSDGLWIPAPKRNSKPVKPGKES